MYDLLFGPDPPVARPPQSLDTIYRQLLRYDRSVIAHNKWAEAAIRNVDFVEGRQWPEAVRQKLEAEGRPCITLNRIRPIVRMLTGYFRQNRYDIEFPPAGITPGSERASETMGMLSKHVSEDNGMPWVDAEVFSEGLVTGRGYYDVRMCFADNALGVVRINSVNPFEVLLDPEADQYDPRHWNWCGILRWMSLDDIEATYGHQALIVAQDTGLAGRTALTTSAYPQEGRGEVMLAPMRGFGLFDYLEGNSDAAHAWNYAGSAAPGGPWDWVNRDRRLLRVLEIQHRVYADTLYFQDTETGEQSMVPLFMDEPYVRRILEWSQSRGFPVRLIRRKSKLVRFTITCADVTLHDNWSPYRSFTLVPFFAGFRRGVTRGIIDDLIDPQMEVNKRRSTYLHIVMTTANSGWSVERGSLDDQMRARLEEEGSRPGLIVEYKAGSQAPQRIQPAVAPQALERLEQQSTDDIKEISGVNDSALGNLDRVQSGRAIMARQRQGLVGNEDLFDNFSRTLEILGRKQLEMFQDHYTQQRVMRLKNRAGVAQQVVLNGQQPDGEVIDITQGSFQVAVDARPMAATFEQAGFEDLKEIVGMGIIPPPLVADILVDASAAPRKSEIKERLAEAQAAMAAMPVDPAAAGAPPPPQGTMENP